MGVWRLQVAAILAIVAGAFGAAALAPQPAAAQIPGVPPIPILENPLADAPKFQGAPAVPNPIAGIDPPPRHPFMAPNERSNIHNDAYQTDVYGVPGPVGDGAEVSTLFVRECASVAFDSQGRIVTVCVGLDQPVLALLHPQTLRTIAAKPLPLRNLLSGTNPFSDFSGGGYFYLDHRDRAVVATNDRRVFVVAITPGSKFAVERTYSLAGAVGPSDGIVSVLPDWDGRLWFVSRSGVVGTIDPGSGAVRRLALGEGISNSFAVDDDGGVYIVSDAALYRFDAGADGAPVVSWREPYPDSGIHKPGQSDAGSGTTPTVMGRRWIAITDNADPMNVRVYRRRTGVRPGRREVCAEPVFRQGASATDQSLIVAGRSIVTENNFGYSGILAVELGRTTARGLARVDVVRSPTTGRWTCRTVWTSSEQAPSVVPKLSLATGLVYTYTKPAGTGIEDPWYLTALDFRTGATVFRRLGGEGLGYNNNYAPVTLGPDGTAYVGVLGGLSAFR
ncbi:MAG: hypothetical protein ACRDKH_02350 [Solirubrobacterales bacterium]